MANSLEAKIVVLGSQGVGKTSFVHRYVKNAFAPPSTQSTIGASFLTKRVIDVDTSTVVRLQIWDTAGQERFRSISKLYYRGMFTPCTGTDLYLSKPMHRPDVSYCAPFSPCDVPCTQPSPSLVVTLVCLHTAHALKLGNSQPSSHQVFLPASKPFSLTRSLCRSKCCSVML